MRGKELQIQSLSLPTKRQGAMVMMARNCMVVMVEQMVLWQVEMMFVQVPMSSMRPRFPPKVPMPVDTMGLLPSFVPEAIPLEMLCQMNAES